MVNLGRLICKNSRSYLVMICIFQSKYWEGFPMLPKLCFGLGQVLTHYLLAKDYHVTLNDGSKLIEVKEKHHITAESDHLSQ